MIARYWTVSEKNALLFSWSIHSGGGVFVYNRLLWITVGFVCLGLVFKLFPMSVETLTASSQGRRAAKARQQEDVEAKPVRSLVASRLPQVHQEFGGKIRLAQLVSLTRIRISNVVRELPFWILLVLMAFFALFFGHSAGKVNDSNVWPVTFLMLGSMEGPSLLLLYIIATFYAGELVWREQDTGFAGIHDALPMNETTDWLSKFFALCFVEFALVTVMGLCGMIMQTAAGYYHYELLQYFQELYLIVLPGVIGYVLLSFFVADDLLQ